MKTCLIVLTATFAFSGCVVERTIKDSKGQTIYQGTELQSPWQPHETRREAVIDKQEELGIFQ